MLNELCERLRFHSLATNEIRLRLKLERAPSIALTLRLPVPMLDPKVLLKLLQLELNERPPQAPVEKIYLELMPVKLRTTQHGLFLPASPEPEKLEITLARIRELVGAANVGAPELLDTHRPDTFRMGTVTINKRATSLLLARSSHSADSVRLIPRRSGAQTTVNPPGSSHPMGDGSIVACAGPWRPPAIGGQPEFGATRNGTSRLGAWECPASIRITCRGNGLSKATMTEFQVSRDNKGFSSI